MLLEWPLKACAVLALVVALSTQSHLANAQERRPCPAGQLLCAGTIVEKGGVLLAARHASLRDVDWGAEDIDPSRCTFTPPPSWFDPERDLADRIAAPRGAIWYVRNCGGNDQYRWYLPSSDEGTDAVVQALVDEAMSRVVPPVPRLVTSPPLGSEVLTGLPMYLAVDDVAFGELSGSVSAGQFTVTARVVPVSSWFSPGDGQGPVVCAGAGSVWSVGERPGVGDCTYTFTRTPVDVFGVGEVFEVVGRVVYEASYTVEGPVLAGSYGLGRLEGPEVVVDVPVIERRAVRTTAGG